MAANPVWPVFFLGAGSAGVRWAVPVCGSACAIAALLVYVRHPESFCPLNKSKWIGSSYAGFAKTESRWLLEFKNIEEAFCKQAVNAPSLGLSQSLVGSNGNMQKGHPAVPAGSSVAFCLGRALSSKEPHVLVTWQSRALSHVLCGCRGCLASSPGGTVGCGWQLWPSPSDLQVPAETPTPSALQNRLRAQVTGRAVC